LPNYKMEPFQNLDVPIVHRLPKKSC